MPQPYGEDLDQQQAEPEARDRGCQHRQRRGAWSNNEPRRYADRMPIGMAITLAIRIEKRVRKEGRLGPLGERVRTGRLRKIESPRSPRSNWPRKDGY